MILPFILVLAILEKVIVILCRFFIAPHWNGKTKKTKAWLLPCIRNVGYVGLILQAICSSGVKFSPCIRPFVILFYDVYRIQTPFHNLKHVSVVSFIGGFHNKLTYCQFLIFNNIWYSYFLKSSIEAFIADMYSSIFCERRFYIFRFLGHFPRLYRALVKLATQLKNSVRMYSTRLYGALVK